MGKLKVISLYVTAEEYQGIAAEAADIGVTMSYYLRALLHQYPPLELAPLSGRGAPRGNQNAAKEYAGGAVGE